MSSYGQGYIVTRGQHVAGNRKGGGENVPEKEKYVFNV